MNFLIIPLVILCLIIQTSHAYSYDIPPHKQIVVEAAEVWVDIPQEIRDHLSGENKLDRFPCSANYDIGDDIFVGSGEEDREESQAYFCILSEHTITNEGRNGVVEHFWNPDFPTLTPSGLKQRGYNCGSEEGLYNLGLPDLSPVLTPSCGENFDSNYRLAQDLWDNKVIPFYKSGRMGESYYWLGRVAHLLSDLGVPAHVHLTPHDPIIGEKDLYEDFVSATVVRKIAERSSLVSPEYRFECFPNLPCEFDWTQIYPSPTNLFKLFWYTAQKTQYWASKSKKREDLVSIGNNSYKKLDGFSEAFNPSLWQGEASPISNPQELVGKKKTVNAKLEAMADALVPHALKAVAGLYRLFWLETHPPIGPVVFEGLGLDFLPNALSADGSTIVGYLPPVPVHAVRWTASGGLELLNEAPEAVSGSAANAVSADGKVIVGTMFIPDHEVFRWTEATGMMGLGDLPGGIVHSLASGVSVDGSVVVGTGHSGIVEAFRWTQTEGMNGLGTLGFYPSSMASAISSDGMVIVGESAGAFGNPEAFRWTELGGMNGLGDLPGEPSGWSRAAAVSANGSVIVGSSLVGPNWQVFRWTQSEGMVSLGTLPGGGDAGASGVSGDGSLIVGLVHFCCPGRAEWFIWDSVNGMRNLKDVLLNEHEIDITGWTPNQAPGIFISAEGQTIAGRGVNPSGQSEVWMVRNFMP